MTRVAARLAELSTISRTRELTEAEQREVIRLAWQERRTGRLRARYASDPDFRERDRAKSRDYQRAKLSDPAYRDARNAKRRAEWASR